MAVNMIGNAIVYVFVKNSVNVLISSTYSCLNYKSIASYICANLQYKKRRTINLID